MKKLKSFDVPVGNGKVLQAIPSGSEMGETDPFLLLHHAERKYVEPGKGFYVGPHPHRGFQPITFVFEGQVHHKDSLGNDQVIKDGGVQWINSASGLYHSEGMSDEIIKNGGYIEFIQLWINLPAKDKMLSPAYYGFQKEDLNTITFNQSELSLVSGTINNLQGPIQVAHAVNSAMLHLAKNDTIELQFDGNSKLIYVLSGSILVNEEIVTSKELIFIEDETKLVLSAQEDARVLVLGANKIDEPIKAYGPFVMNTQREIIDALNDAHSGKMGYLKE